MKKLIKFASLLVLGCAVVGLNACTPEKKEKKVAEPTNLSYSNVTHNSATLTWQGTTTSYEIEVGNIVADIVNAKTFPLTELEPETPYTWRVRAVDGDRKSEWVDGETFTTEPEPIIVTPVPTELAYSDVTQTEATFTWQHVDADAHEIVINDRDAVALTEPTYTADDLEPNTAYTWKVRSAKEGVWSDWVDGEGFTTDPTPTPVPTDLAYSDVTHNSATFTWQHVDADVHEIVINNRDAVSLTEPTYTADDLEPETAQTWKVRSAKEGIWSEWVDGEGFTTATALPTNLVYSNVTHNSATFTWQHTSAIRHELIVGDRAAVTVLSTATAPPLRSISGLEPETEYTWKVRSRSVSTSVWSEWVEGEPFTTEKTPVVKPSNLSLSGATHNSATLTWQGSTASYEIEVGDVISEIVDAKTFEATGLSPETSYTWRVRAIDDNDNTRTSDWVNGSAFTTTAEGGDRTQLLTIESTGYKTIMPTIGHLTILFSNVTDGNGTLLAVEFLITPVNNTSEIIDIPVGTYGVNSSFTIGSIFSAGDAYFRIVTNDTVGIFNRFTQGTVVVEGDRTNYHITFDIIFGGETLKYEYNGPISIPNPLYVE